MTQVTVSTKYQVVIPKVVRELLDIEPGQKVQMVPYMGRIELIPVRNMAEAQGFLSGIDTRIDREDDRI